MVDRRHDRRRSLYLCSWQRSGSTWLAEMVASAPRTRLVYEPANIRQHFFVDGEPRLVSLPFAGPGDDLGEDGVFLDRAVRGALQTRWSNQLNTATFPTRRVVKDVRTVSVLPWAADRYDDVPMVLLLRHPLAVAHSIVELGWTMNAPSLRNEAIAAHDPALATRLRADALLAEVTHWAAHHAWAMRHPATARVHVVFYEHLAAEPVRELDRLSTYLTDFHPVWRDWQPDVATIGRPSSTAFRGDRSTSAAWVDSWSSHYDAATVATAGRILRAHGLDMVYGDAPEPLLDAAGVLAAVRSSRPTGA